MRTGLGLLGVLMLTAAAAAAERSVRGPTRAADVIVVGRLVSADEPLGGAGRDGEATLSFSQGEIAVEAVLKGPLDLTSVTLQWLREAAPGRQAAAEGGLWARGAMPAQSFKLGDRGLWFLTRTSLAAPVYSCVGADRFVAADDAAFGAAVAGVRLAMSIEADPRAPIADGLQLTLEPTRQVYPADGPVPVKICLRNVGRLEGGRAGSADGEKRIVYRFDGKLLDVHSTAEVRPNGGRALDAPPWQPAEQERGEQTVELGLGVAQSAVYDVARWIPAEAGLYKLTLISQPPGCPRLTSNAVWICRDVAPTDGLVLIAQVYRPRSAAAVVPMLKVSLVNVTEEPIRVPLLDDRFFTQWCGGGIVDEADRNVRWAPTLRHRSTGPQEHVQLAQGAMRTLTAPLAALAEFPAPGRYTLRLLCRMPGVGLLASNEVPFDVLPPPR